MNAYFLTLTIGFLAVFAVIAAVAAGAAIKVLSGRLARTKAERIRMSLPSARRAPGPAVGASIQRPAAIRPKPRPAPRLDAYLFAPDTPKRVSLPVRTTRGRILEIGLPLHLRWTGERDLTDLHIEAELPNDITYGPSLERMIAEGLPCGLSGGGATYASGLSLTTVRDRAARLAPGAETVVFIPIAVKHGQTGAYPICISVSSAGAPSVRLDHVLELVAPTDVCANAEAWLCVPDETARTRDARLPLDRITSARFGRVDA